MLGKIGQSLSAKFLLFVSLVSLICATCFIGFQVLRDYRIEMAAAETRLSAIANSYQASVATALWNVDDGQIKATFEGLLKLPGVAYLETEEADGNIKNFGQKPERFFRVETALINDAGKEIGKLSLFSDENEIINGIKDRAKFMLGAQLLSISFIAALIMLISSKMITSHLGVIKDHLVNIDLAKGVTPLKLSRMSLFNKSPDELEILATSITKMETDLFKYTNELEGMVRARTAELSERNRNISKILGNIKQGIVTFDDSLTLSKDHSLYMQELFHTKSIAGSNFFDLAFNGVSLSANDRSQVHSAVTSSFDVNEFAYEFNSHLLPRELARETAQGRQVLELDWDIMLGENGAVEKMMVVVRDVTEMRKLAAKSQEQQAELAILQQIIKVGDKEIDKFLNRVDLILEKHRQINTGHDELAVMFRDLHTVKGNARMMGLGYIVDKFHEAESCCAKVQKAEGVATSEIEMMGGYLSDAQKVVLKYRQTLAKMKRTGDDNFNRKVQSLLDAIDHKANMATVIELRQNLNFKPLSVLLDDVVKGSEKTAQALKKEPPQVVFNEHGVEFDQRHQDSLRDIFIHCINNAIDHGIETNEERLAKGKSQAGTIFFNIQPENNGQISIEFSDDGGGLDIEKLKKVGLARKLIHEKSSVDEIANIILAPNISTKDAVTEISGRGVGLDAAKSLAEKLGGSLTAQVDSLQYRPASKVPFKLVLVIPKKVTNAGLSSNLKAA